MRQAQRCCEETFRTQCSLLRTAGSACSCLQGAVDDLDRILAILQAQGYSEDRFFIHCDGALFGLMVRLLLPKQQRLWLRSTLLQAC